MIEEVRLPEISENVETGEVLKVLVNQDDFVEKEQSLVELETDKAAFEVPSPVAGKVAEIMIQEGDEVSVGQVIMKIDTEAEPGQEQAEEGGEEPEPAKEGDEEPAGKEPPKPKERPKEPKEEKRSSAPPKTGEREKPAEKPESDEPVPAAPSVRQLARELGIDIQDVSGSAEAGRITADDVKAYARNLITSGGGAGKPAGPKHKALPDFSRWGEIERQQISTTRKKIAETLSYAWSTVPQVTQHDQADITQLEQSRKAFSRKSGDSGSKLTVTAIALKIAALALREFPKLNASFDPEKNEIIYKHFVNISVAVETDRGLLVPVIRDVDKKGIVELSDELNDLAERTRQHKVTPDDMVGGNFTISNLGGIGGGHFSPIIYWPQVAILGIGRASEQPVYKNNALEPRLTLPLSLSYDHRMIDGVEGLVFLRWIVNYLDNPFLLVLDEII